MPKKKKKKVKKQKLSDMKDILYDFRFHYTPDKKLLEKALDHVEEFGPIEEDEIQALNTEEKSIVVCSAYKKDELLATSFVFNVYEKMYAKPVRLLGKERLERVFEKKHGKKKK